MKAVNDLLKELGISKVKLSRYLGVSRQMVYNYLEMKSLNDWPKDKKVKLLLLFNVSSAEEIANFKPTTENILRIEKMMQESENENGLFSIDAAGYDFKDLSKKNQKVIMDIVTMLKEKLSEDTKDAGAYNMCRYLCSYLQVIDDVPELKYVLAYFAKSNGFIPTNEFAFDEDNQIIFEGIMYQAITLFNNGGVSKHKVLEAHKKFEAEVEQRHEEKLSRTQELNTVKIQALKELGYTEINPKNATEVFEKIAEIQSRKI